MVLTERFKKAVKQYVADGNLSKEEKDDLLKIAKEDKINETDAVIYINSELKKVNGRKQLRKEIIETAKAVGSIIVTVGGFALTVFTAVKSTKK